MINYLPGGIYDPTPLVVRFCQQEQPKSRPFKFLNIIAADERFIPTVQGAWRTFIGRHRMKQVWENLQQVKIAVKTLHSHHYSQAHKKVEEFIEHLNLVQQDPNINACEEV